MAEVEQKKQTFGKFIYRGVELDQPPEMVGSVVSVYNGKARWRSNQK